MDNLTPTFTCTPQVPLRACSIQTPQCPAAWQTALLHHPNQQLTEFFLDEAFILNTTTSQPTNSNQQENNCKKPYNILLLWINTLSKH